MGGKIEAISHPEQGSSFFLLLPFVLSVTQQPDNELIPHKTRKTPARPLDGMRILVVNESVANQVFMTTILIDAGATTECVNNGTDAIERIQTEQLQGRYFDLVLMDSSMIQMSGYQVIYELRNRGFMRPVILLGSAYDKPLRLPPLTNNVLLRKPIDRIQLIQTITAMTQKNKTQPFSKKKMYRK
jgi:CheY-like chemotaxis protein